MKITSKMRGEYGDYKQRQYQVRVSESGGTVTVWFTNLGDTEWEPKGGRLELPSPIASRIADALRLASSGPLKEPVVFEVDEDKLA